MVSEKSQSIQATASSSTGAPEEAARQSTPANLSPVLEANRRHRSSWSAASTLTQKDEAVRSFA